MTPTLPCETEAINDQELTHFSESVLAFAAQLIRCYPVAPFLTGLLNRDPAPAESKGWEAGMDRVGFQRVTSPSSRMVAPPSRASMSTISACLVPRAARPQPPSIWCGFPLKMMRLSGSDANQA